MMLCQILALCLSLLAPAASGTVATPSLSSLSDARLKQLVECFAGEDGTKAEATLRRAGLDRVLPRLERLQRKTPRNEDLYFDLAFTLAYFGADYRRNVQRLTALDELWNRGDQRWYEYVGNQSDMRDAIPELMASLYRHNHDLALLRTLFSWGLDGAAAEVLDVVRVQLLTHDPLRVIRCIRNSADREEGAISSLSDGVGADEAEYRRAVRSIRLASRSMEPSMRQYSQRLLRRAAARWKISHHGKSLRSADLAGMNLSGMDLTNLDLRHADLRRAQLQNTHLQGANLAGADLRGARYNRRTRWPKGFDPRRHGAVLLQ